MARFREGCRLWTCKPGDSARSQPPKFDYPPVRPWCGVCGTNDRKAADERQELRSDQDGIVATVEDCDLYETEEKALAAYHRLCEQHLRRLDEQRAELLHEMRTFRTPLLKAIDDLRNWVPEDGVRLSAVEAAFDDPTDVTGLDVIGLLRSKEEELRGKPFFCESVCYELFGKDEARTLAALLRRVQELAEQAVEDT